MIRRPLSADCAGATAIEFALLAPVFLLLLFGIVEVGRLVWVKQVLTETAYSAARCAATGSPCKTVADVQSYVVARGSRLGVRIAASQTGYTASTTCDGNSGSVLVTIRYGFASPLAGFLPVLPATVQAHGCFPTLS